MRSMLSTSSRATSRAFRLTVAAARTTSVRTSALDLRRGHRPSSSRRAALSSSGMTSLMSGEASTYGYEPGALIEPLLALLLERLRARIRDRSIDRPDRQRIAAPACRAALPYEALERILLVDPRREHGNRPAALRHDEALPGLHPPHVPAEVLPELTDPDALLHFRKVAHVKLHGGGGGGPPPPRGAPPPPPLRRG